MADEDDPYFGYNENSLEPGYVPPPLLPGYKPPQNPFISRPAPFYYSDEWQGNKNGTSDDDGPAGGDGAEQIDNADIDVINKWIMGEQPGTTAERGQQWMNVAQLLQNTAQTLHDQTQTLAEGWESPGAKAVFLEKVGMTLAYLRVWQDAAIKNSVALYGLSNVMYEAQAEMKTLYQEYAYVTGALQYLADQPPNAYTGTSVMPQRKVDEEKDKYTDKARKLAHKYAGEYAPYISKLEAGRAKALDPINAIAHPEALGLDLPKVPPPGAPPGGPPGGAPPGGPPTGAPPGGPKNDTPPTGTPPGGPKNFTDQPPGPGDQKTPPGTPPAAPPPAAPPGVPQNLVPPGASDVTPPGATPPGVTPPGIPPAAFSALPPGLMPNAFGGGKLPPASFSSNNPSPGLFDGSKAPNTTPPTLGNTSVNNAVGGPPGGFSSPSTPNSLYPPGTITPPPGSQLPESPREKSPGENQPGIPSYGEQSFTDHLEVEAKSVAQQQAAATPPPPSLPPGTSVPNSHEGKKSGPPSSFADGGYTEQSPAFQAPPSTTPPVLGNDAKRKQRGGNRSEAPATPPGLGAPPVLSNPHRKPPEKTFTEKLRERKRAKRPALPGMPGSEFAANLPTGIDPVFDGRFSAEEYVVGSAGEIPNVLQAPAPVVAAPDRHAKPVVHADRAQRIARKDDKAPVRDETAFEVETPGGPVVAGGGEERRYRPAEPSPLDGRS